MLFLQTVIGVLLIVAAWFGSMYIAVCFFEEYRRRFEFHCCRCHQDFGRYCPECQSVLQQKDREALARERDDD